MATYTHPVTGEVKEYIPYDELTEEQRECVNCAEDNQRYDAACAHLGIDKLMSDRNALIRNRIASDGFFLESFAEDDDPLVRAEVALQGYGLDILVFDSEWCGFAEDYDFTVSSRAMMYLGDCNITLETWTMEHPDARLETASDERMHLAWEEDGDGFAYELAADMYGGSLRILKSEISEESVVLHIEDARCSEDVWSSKRYLAPADKADRVAVELMRCFEREFNKSASSRYDEAHSAMDKDLLGSCFETACSLTTTIKAAKAAQMKASKVDAGNAGIKQ